MWAQQWGNIWDLVEPYKDAGSLDLSSTLQAHRDAQFKRLLADFKGSPTALEQAELSHQAALAVATKMTQRAEDFYHSLGIPALPATFYERCQWIKPCNREVVCTSNAWDRVSPAEERIKRCR